MKYKTRVLLEGAAEFLVLACILIGFVWAMILFATRPVVTHNPPCYQGGGKVVAKGHAAVPGHESIRPGEMYYWYVCAGESER